MSLGPSTLPRYGVELRTGATESEWSRIIAAAGGDPELSDHFLKHET